MHNGLIIIVQPKIADKPFIDAQVKGRPVAFRTQRERDVLAVFGRFEQLRIVVWVDMVPVDGQVVVSVDAIILVVKTEDGQQLGQDDGLGLQKNEFGFK